ncbi:MAG: sigma-70 family RNA polymerase sigma factor [Lysinibacillus sp.]
MVNDQTFRDIFDQHADSLLAISYTYVKDWAAAEDIVQDVFIKYWQTHEQFRQDSSLKTYLTRMCINRSKDYLKSWRYRTQKLTNQFFGTQPQKEQLLIAEEQQEIGQAVLQLPIHFRELVLLYYYENYTYRNISTLLGIPESTVRSRLNKAKSTLKQVLPNEHWEVLLHDDEA